MQDASGGAVDSGGASLARSEGSYAVTVTADGISDSATIEVKAGAVSPRPPKHCR